MPAGSVYILSNPSFREGLLKIGKTTLSVDARARHLRGTGVPEHFKVETSVAVQDCGLVETVVHRRLATHRCVHDREFFDVPLALAIAVLEEVANQAKDPRLETALETEWRATVKTTGETDRFAAFQMRVERCSMTIAVAFRALKAHVEPWAGVTTGIDSKVDGMTFYRNGRRFLRLDPKHSARVDNIGVAFFQLTHEEVRAGSGVATREELKQDGVWIFIQDEKYNASLLRLARQAYDRLS